MVHLFIPHNYQYNNKESYLFSYVLLTWNFSTDCMQAFLDDPLTTISNEETFLQYFLAILKCLL